MSGDTKLHPALNVHLRIAVEKIRKEPVNICTWDVSVLRAYRKLQSLNKRHPDRNYDFWYLLELVQEEYAQNELSALYWQAQMSDDQMEDLYTLETCEYIQSRGIYG